jgi:hypothetical protein
MKSEYLSVYSDSAFSGIGLVALIPGINDYVVTQHFYNGNYGKPTRRLLYSSAKGVLYFKAFGRRYFLSDFIKSNLI